MVFWKEMLEETRKLDLGGARIRSIFKMISYLWFIIRIIEEKGLWDIRLKECGAFVIFCNSNSHSTFNQKLIPLTLIPSIDGKKREFEDTTTKRMSVSNKRWIFKAEKN